MDIAPQSRFRGCLLAGAVGDALGAAVEFLSEEQIVARYGPAGIREPDVAYGRVGAITDDTQMTLFTAEGLLRGHVRGSARGILHWPSMLGGAYQRWLLTQGNPDWKPASPWTTDGWLFGLADLHARRAPGRTCIGALIATPTGMPARNHSKGCGGVMRVAPVGLYAWAQVGGEQLARSFKLGCEAAALTHGHPTGILSAGAFAALVQLLADGTALRDALPPVMALLAGEPEHEETRRALVEACELAASEPDAQVATLGQGWIADEALAIAVFVALTAPDLETGLRRAVNHSGDSDSTGAIAGNLLGAMLGDAAIPARWLDGLELRHEIAQVADDLLASARWDFGAHAPAERQPEAVLLRYPGQ